MDDRVQIALADEVRANLVNKSAENVGKTTVTADEHNCFGKKNSQKVNMLLTNANANAMVITFGTPLSDATDYQKVPSGTLGQLVTGTDVFWLANLADLTDNQGVDGNFLQLFNKRLRFAPLVASTIEVIAGATALAQAQKDESIKVFDIPYNSANGVTVDSGDYIAQDLEYTAVYLSKRELILGEFMGVSYRILPASSIKINLPFAMVSAPTFVSI